MDKPLPVKIDEIGEVCEFCMGYNHITEWRVRLW
jgi:hypothetical protein